ncbi:glutamine-dependent NAD(+) synthetase [Rubritalea halochordaticola]|uniref:Glutamine-dependent NAD(+) synthetase n=1 Tax=Rubritalea halochordaticola TaxID=714537 RepID=A0ABP9UWM5_9BACT
MKTIHVAAASVNQIPLDWEGNLSRILKVIEEARGLGVSMLCLPELALTGYGCEDAFMMPNTVERAEQMLGAVKAASEGMVIAVGLPWRHHHTMFNVAAVLANGELLGLVGKQHLAGDGLHYEPRWFSEWPRNEVVVTTCLGQEVLLGDLMFEVGGVRFGFEICEDAWSADRPGSALSAYGLDFVLNPSASHFAFGKQRLRERFVNEGARAYGCAYIYANLLGNESGRVVFDGGPMISNAGDLVSYGDRFSFKDHTLITAHVDVEVNRTKQVATASRRVEVSDHVGLVQSYWELPADHKAPSPHVDRPEWSKEEEFAHAIGLALFDYMRKSYSRGFVVSLSGGADSSAVSCLVKIALDLALSELGKNGVRERLQYMQLSESSADWMKALLVCVYQASKHSGDATEQSAEELAKYLGSEYQMWEIADLVEGYTSMVSKGLGRELTWETDDVPLQNIQARVRAPGIWMLANVRSALLLATSNRSEAAVGYATMDGDTCGGLSPVAGIDKAFLREWLVWLETVGSERIQQVPALNYVNNLQPTAELRPADHGQTDEGDLMPYPVLDAIERAAIRDKRAPQDVLTLMGDRFDQYEHEQLKQWVIKFFRLWSRNQWKRERYAPSFHVDDENLDPKTWCRFPILSGGFQKELSELQ